MRPKKDAGNVCQYGEISGKLVARHMLLSPNAGTVLDQPSGSIGGLGLGTSGGGISADSSGTEISELALAVIPISGCWAAV